MNKSQLIDKITTGTNISKVTAVLVLERIITVMTDSLKLGNDVTLVGFGTFTIRKRPERIGRNPKTGKEITIVAATVPVFRAGKTLKDAVNKAIR
ncbi:HU family DNA-binding protein [Candidatus Gillettellia adelgis]